MSEGKAVSSHFMAHAWSASGLSGASAHFPCSAAPQSQHMQLDAVHEPMKLIQCSSGKTPEYVPNIPDDV